MKDIKTNEEYVKMIQNGQRQYLTYLWINIEKIIKRLVLPYYSRDQPLYDLNDLMQAAYFGFEKAVQQYDPAKGFKFTTYLTFHITRAVKRELCILGKRDPIFDSSSLNIEVKSPDENDNLTFLDTLTDESIEDFAERAAHQDAIRQLVSAINRLDYYEKEVFRRYVIGHVSAVEIATLLKISLSDVRKYAEHAVGKIKRSKEAVRLREHYIDLKTPFYYRKSLIDFRNTRFSAVEEVVFKREKILNLLTEMRNEK